MKIENMIRVQVVGISLAALLLVSAPPVRSQEITNTEFSDGPYVTAYSQPASDNQVTPVQTSEATAAEAPATAVVPPPVSNEQLSSLANLTGDWLLVSALSGVGLIGLYAIVEARRGKPNTRSARRATRRVAFS